MLLVTCSCVLFVHLFCIIKGDVWSNRSPGYQRISWLESWCHIHLARYEPKQRYSLHFIALTGRVIWCWRCFCQGRYSRSKERGFPLGQKWSALILLLWSTTINAIDLVLYTSILSLPLLFHAAVNNKTYSRDLGLLPSCSMSLLQKRKWQLNQTPTSCYNLSIRIQHTSIFIKGIQVQDPAL